jgi:hypothetical protein
MYKHTLDTQTDREGGAGGVKERGGEGERGGRHTAKMKIIIIIIIFHQVD